jgi:hypothetical protein
MMQTLTFSENNWKEKKSVAVSSFQASFKNQT